MYARGLACQGRLRSAEQIGFQITRRHSLNAWVGVDRSPQPERNIVLQRAMLRGSMRRLAHKPQQQLRPALPRHRKAHRIAIPLRRQSRTIHRIPQIAELCELFHGGNGAFVSGSAAMSLPPTPQGQARRMQPGSAFQPVRRHEEWARQLGSPLRERGHCTQEEGIPPVPTSIHEGRHPEPAAGESLP